MADFARIERYEALRARLRDLVERGFHHNLAAATDLDELERALGRLEAVVAVVPGRVVSAPVMAEAAPSPPPPPKPVAKPVVAKVAKKVQRRPAARPKPAAPKAPPAERGAEGAPGEVS
ncbi:hypothetical protein [Caldovatus aquaticus]|uniref:Uncharacterized protein n=1 Tax=Caldovatus aquaticus TaxID=2865671 RepID=A0ABS7EYG8_9PROT|nr:hypothetical protein [Caldovatus aquaticus]MBW8268298.1 hypothetical protein [Caldovatus aquaticus]